MVHQRDQADERDFDEREMFAWIEAQATMGIRRAGSPGGARNEDFLEQQLMAFGLVAVRREPIPITYCEATQWQLEIGDERGLAPIPAYPIPYTAFTDGSSAAAMVYADPKSLRAGSAAWRGKVVVTEIRFPPLPIGLLERIGLGVHDPDGAIQNVRHPATWVRLGWHLYRRAARWGAAGFIGVLRDQPGGTCEMYAPYGFREDDFLDKPVPGFWARRQDGPALLALARSGRGRARLYISGQRRAAVTHNIVGEIPGTDSDSDETVILGCHHDAPFVSPVEDGSGVAVVLSIAKYLARRRHLRRRVLVTFTAGHFYGSIGTRALIEHYHAGALGKVALEIHIEHIAKEAVEDAGGELVPTGLAEPTGVFVPMNQRMVDLVLSSVREAGLDRSILLPPEGPLGDFPPTDGGDWYAAGVPVINAISNPVYLLTNDDALRWVDRPRLRRAARAFSQILERVDGLTAEEIGAVDLRGRLLLMRLLRHLQKARTTFFGLRPLY
jgi:hypothetical protein